MKPRKPKPLYLRELATPDDTCWACGGSGEVIVNGDQAIKCPECTEGPDPDRFWDEIKIRRHEKT